ncbi:MAG: class I SAM-dependent methyltransferase [Acidimicrobiales bacterium]
MIDNGTVVDVGCGVGLGTRELIGPGRTVIGVDYDLYAAGTASARSDGAYCVLAADGAGLPLADRSVDWIVSSHIIEHFVHPETHVTELARVLRPGGTALVLTPNETTDFENPFHVHLFSPDSLARMLGRHFEEVQVGGHDGTPEVKADFAARRAQAAKVLRLDPLGLRFRIPRSWYVAAYATGTRAFYRLQARRHAGGATTITAGDFAATEVVDETTLSLFATARSPR